MARWLAIVALLLGMGLTAFESFSASTDSEAPVTIMEGNTPWPTEKPPTLGDDRTSKAPDQYVAGEAVSSER
jgi:hypothetical protein